MRPWARLRAVVAPFAVASAAIAICAHALAGQSFSMRLERGELGFDARGFGQVQGAAAGQSARDLQQWLRVPVSGFLIHPAFMRYAVSVRPRFGQHTATTVEQGTHDRSLGVDFSSTLFQARRMTLSMQATRSTGSSQGSFGTESNFRNKTSGVMAFIRDDYFPTTISYTSRDVDDTWSSAYTFEPIRRDQRDSRLRIEMRNRKLNAIVERVGHEDRRGPDDHTASTAQFRHRAEWGKGSTVNSTLNVYRRTGASPIARSAWGERIYLSHTRAVGTALSFGRQTWQRGGQAGRNLAGSLGTQFRPDIPFEGELALSGQSFRSGLGTGSLRVRFAPSVRYRIDLPRGIAWTIVGSSGLERLVRDFPSDELLDVLEESHEIDAVRRFGLNQLRVDRESIEVWDDARVLHLIEGVDYWIVETGPFLEIQIPPGSRVTEGQTVLVNYRFQAIADERSSLFYLNYETSLRMDGLTVRHGRRQRSEDFTTEGGAAGAQNDVDIWYGAGFSRRTRYLGLTLDVSRRERDSREAVYISDELRGEVTPRRLGAIETRLRLSITRTNAGGSVTRSSTIGGTLSAPLTRSIRFSGGVNAWSWQQDESVHIERFVSGQGQIVWQFGQVNTIVSFDQVRRSNGIDRVENRWSMRVVRRF